jgi:hypothetical protein
MAPNAPESIGERLASSKWRRDALGVANANEEGRGGHGGTVQIESDRGTGTRVKLVMLRRQAGEGGGKSKSWRQARG